MESGESLPPPITPLDAADRLLAYIDDPMNCGFGLAAVLRGIEEHVVRGDDRADVQRIFERWCEEAYFDAASISPYDDEEVPELDTDRFNENRRLILTEAIMLIGLDPRMNLCDTDRLLFLISARDCYAGIMSGGESKKNILHGILLRLRRNRLNTMTKDALLFDFGDFGLTALYKKAATVDRRDPQAKDAAYFNAVRLRYNLKMLSKAGLIRRTMAWRHEMGGVA